ncbi:MAG: helix-turn-helix domain-containing protein [Nitrospiraceae bacterium]|nr:MAG: helix-turn-helix domain-containing protein [Nitrospiraceae bacterium]
MDTPGKILKAERERQNKSLEEIAQNQKLNITYLQAVENDDYRSLPAELYARAYLRFFAAELGLDSDLIIGLYEKQMQPADVNKPLPAAGKTSSRYRTTLMAASLLLVAVLVSIIAVSKYTGRKPVETVTEIKKQEAVVPEKPGPVEDAKETGIGTDIKPETVTPPMPTGLSLKISVTEPSWISVGTDGGETKEWLMSTGEEISLVASEKFLIKIGNAGGTKIIFNGDDLGTLGQRGEVVNLVLPKSADDHR